MLILKGIMTREYFILVQDGLWAYQSFVLRVCYETKIGIVMYGNDAKRKADQHAC